MTSDTRNCARCGSLLPDTDEGVCNTCKTPFGKPQLTGENCARCGALLPDIDEGICDACETPFGKETISMGSLKFDPQRQKAQKKANKKANTPNESSPSISENDISVSEKQNKTPILIALVVIVLIIIAVVATML